MKCLASPMSKRLMIQLKSFMYVNMFGTREKTLDQGYHKVKENLRRAKIINRCELSSKQEKYCYI
jgi:hypothetical protein